MITDGQMISDQELQTLLICSFRYALGRRTYVTEEIPDLIRRYKSVLKPWHFEQMIKDIESSVNNTDAGDRGDVDRWIDLKDWLRSEL